MRCNIAVRSPACVRTWLEDRPARSSVRLASVKSPVVKAREPSRPVKNAYGWPGR